MMKELNMSIYTNKDGENKVSLTATFATHEEAVAFHDDAGALCRKHSPAPESETAPRGWSMKRITG